jgi:hypothetical protein
MSTGLKANDDGSAAIQVGGSDYLTVTSGGAATFVTSPTTMPAQTLHPAGSVGAPSISFVGDTNTGIYRYSSDVVGITSAGTLQAYFGIGEFAFNGGYGSVAPAYGCRAWVNFDGRTTANSDINASYSQSGTTVTVNTSPSFHNFQAGSVIFNDVTSGTGVDGPYTVTAVIDSFSFTYTAGTSLTTSGTCILRQNLIRASANVSSIADQAVGAYGVNFTTAMPDANYSFQMNAQYDTASLNNGNIASTVNRTTNAVSPQAIRIVTFVCSSAGLIDCAIVSVAIFR